MVVDKYDCESFQVVPVLFFYYLHSRIISALSVITKKTINPVDVLMFSGFILNKININSN